jgi:hypothetical protein
MIGKIVSHLPHEIINDNYGYKKIELNLYISRGESQNSKMED